jgi:hypothetical protein
MYEYGVEWYQNLPSESYQLYNPIKQNESHIKFLINNVHYNKSLPIINLIVFSRSCELKNNNITTDYVHVVYEDELFKYINSYEWILKRKIEEKGLHSIKDQLIQLDRFSVEKLNEHIERINRRYNSPED